MTKSLSRGDIQVGTVDPTWDGNGGVLVRFQPANNAGTYRMPYLRGYVPQQGDEVLVQRVGSGWVCIGRTDGKLVRSVTTPSWQNLTLLNSWVDYDPSWSSAQYMVDTRTGWVHLRGMIKNGTTSQIASIGTVLAPPKNIHCIAPVGTHKAGEVQISSAGSIDVNYGASGTNAFVSLDGLMWPTNNSATASAHVGALASWRPATTLAGGSYNYLSDDTWWEPGMFEHPAGYGVTTGVVSGITGNPIYLQWDAAMRQHKMDLYPGLGFNAGAYTAPRIDFIPGGAQLAAGSTNTFLFTGGYRVHDVSTENLWTPLTLSNSWAEYRVAGDYRWRRPEWRQDLFGFVHVRGLIRAGTITAGTNIVASGQLPLSSDAKFHFFVSMDGANGPATVQLTTGGALQTSNVTNNGYLSLSHIMYHGI